MQVFAGGMTRVCRPAFFALLLSLLCFPELSAAARRRAVSVAPANDLTIAFVDAPGGTVDAGWIAGKSRRKFALRIGAPSREARGTATLRAFLETPDPRCIVRLDGIVLTAQPQIIDRFAPIGITTTHRLEIEIPKNAAEGALVTSIGWDVSTD